MTVAFTGGPAASGWEYDAEHRPFLDGSGSPRIELDVHCGDLPSIKWSSLRYAGRRAPGGRSRLWAIRRTADGFLVAVKGPTRSTSPSRLARFDATWSRGEVFVRVDGRYSGAGRYPLEFPLEVVLFPGLLAHLGGAVLHAAGAIKDGRGFVFAGRSGAGKTTLAALLGAHGWDILNDERVIVRADGDRVTVFGTPWPGDLGRVSARSAPLAGIFLLEHAPTTLTAPLGAAAAAGLLVPRCRLPFWDRRGIDRLLGAIEHVVRRVPCYRLAFAPDASVVEFLDRFGADALVGA